MEVDQAFVDAFSKMEAKQEEGVEAWLWLADYVDCLTALLRESASTGDMVRFGATAREYTTASRYLTEFSALVIAGHVTFTGADHGMFIQACESDHEKSEVLRSSSELLHERGWSDEWLELEDDQ